MALGFVLDKSESMWSGVVRARHQSSVLGAHQSIRLLAPSLSLFDYGTRFILDKSVRACGLSTILLPRCKARHHSSVFLPDSRSDCCRSLECSITALGFSLRPVREHRRFFCTILVHQLIPSSPLD